MSRVLVVSHPCVIDINQCVYLELRRRGWELRIVVPARWRHEYRHTDFAPTALAGLEDALLPLPILLPGRPQRHVYVIRPATIVRNVRPDLIFLEQEPFSVAALQWSIAAGRFAVPFGVQADENLNRPFPLLARVIRHRVLRRATFVAARTPSAARLVEVWGARGCIAVAPHAVPTWPLARVEEQRPFTVGFAGRLVPEKGIDDLLAAVSVLEPPVRLLVAGAGPLAQKVEQAAWSGLEVEILGGLGHSEMGSIFARMDVLVLPSRTTPTWTEQFGRVLVEALSQRTPVVGSDSGEIPWVIETTGGGLVFPEGQPRRLAEALEALRHNPAWRAELGARGAEAVNRLFSVSAAADKLEALFAGALA